MCQNVVVPAVAKKKQGTALGKRESGTLTKKAKGAVGARAK